MTQEQKSEIQSLLHEYVAQYPSQSKAAASLDGVSEATIINIRKGNWDNIAESMWRKIAKQLGKTSS